MAALLRSVCKDFLSAIFLALVASPLPSTESVSCARHDSSYDFVVVGGGTGGLAVASRLSEGLPNSCILVLEAGPDVPNEPKINIPGMKGSTFGTVYDWNFSTVPQPHAHNRSLAQTRGKVLGGSSALNLMVWDRGSSVEYDAWGKLGNAGWNWSSMMEAMLRVENFSKPDAYGGEGVGFGGPIQTLINDYVPAQQEFYIPTLENLGVPQNLISSGGNPLGTMFQPSSIRHRDRKRSYSAHNPGYPSIAASNLQIRTGLRVQKIDLHKCRGQLVATGVTLTDGSVIAATKEVILSAGSIQSPGLLELSGIGDKAVLMAARIPQLLDLPGVGTNLQDHLRIQLSYQLGPNFTSFDILKFNTTYASEQLAAYNAGNRSMYDYSGSGYAFVNLTQAAGNSCTLLSLARQAATHPVTLSPFELVRSRVLLEYLTDKEEIVPQIEIIFSDGYTGVKGYPPPSSPLYGSYFFTLIAGIQHPFSMGSVHITSSSISTPPRINPNYLAQDYDVQALVAAAKYARKIASIEPLRHVWVAEYEPGLDVVGDGPDAEEQWKQYVLNNSHTLYHPVGTCAMLPRHLFGVVDPQLQVYGTRNLRVVDASVIPILVTGHTQTAVYGIAERAAKMIVDRWSS